MSLLADLLQRLIKSRKPVLRIPVRIHLKFFVKVDRVILKSPPTGPGNQASHRSASQLESPDQELDASASMLWLSLDGRRDVRELARLLGERFRIHPSRAVERVNRILTYFERQGWIRFVSKPTALVRSPGPGRPSGPGRPNR